MNIKKSLAASILLITIGLNTPILHGQSKGVPSYVCGLEEAFTLEGDRPSDANALADKTKILTIDINPVLPMDTFYTDLPLYTSSIRAIGSDEEPGLYCYHPPVSDYTVCSNAGLYLTLHRENLSLTVIENAQLPLIGLLTRYSCEGTG